jgi:hypothetical protein
MITITSADINGPLYTVRHDILDDLKTHGNTIATQSQCCTFSHAIQLLSIIPVPHQINERT